MTHRAFPSFSIEFLVHHVERQRMASCMSFSSTWFRVPRISILVSVQYTGSGVSGSFWPIGSAAGGSESRVVGAGAGEARTETEARDTATRALRETMVKFWTLRSKLKSTRRK